MNTENVVSWFLSKNKNLAIEGVSCRDKLRLLLDVSCSMFDCVFGKSLLSDGFDDELIPEILVDLHDEVKGDLNGGLIKAPLVADKNELQVLEIVNFVFADCAIDDFKFLFADELVGWSSSEKTIIDEVKLSDEMELPCKMELSDEVKISDEKSYLIKLYTIYKDYDFDNVAVECVNGNKYIYFKDNLQMTTDVIRQLKKIHHTKTPIFVELIQGELVFS